MNIQFAMAGYLCHRYHIIIREELDYSDKSKLNNNTAIIMY